MNSKEKLLYRIRLGLFVFFLVAGLIGSLWHFESFERSYGSFIKGIYPKLGSIFSFNLSVSLALAAEVTKLRSIIRRGKLNE